MKRYKLLTAKILLGISALFFFADYEKLEFLWIQAIALVVALICIRYIKINDNIGKVL